MRFGIPPFACGKQSFFEKKDQKTFVNLVRDSPIKVFASFFKKKSSLT
jgi:hypothetical protein